MDLIIEAVFEDLAIKQQVFRELDAIARPGCILASNTSTLDIDAIASVTSRPSAVVGLHFFSPAAVMRLLEIVRGARRRPTSLPRRSPLPKASASWASSSAMDRASSATGLFFPYMYEAQFLVEDGATPAQVDRALTEFGMAMGIFAVDDLAGLDVGWRVRQAMGHFSDPSERRPLVHDRLVELGRFGQKAGKGWYRYDDSRTPAPDPEVDALIRVDGGRSRHRPRRSRTMRSCGG